MNRLYVAEAAPTPTGTLADHRLRARPSELPALLRGVARASVGAAPGDVDGAALRATARAWVAAAAADLRAARGAGIVLAGVGQPAAASRRSPPS